jgi:hypothetical protein
MRYEPYFYRYDLGYNSESEVLKESHKQQTSYRSVVVEREPLNESYKQRASYVRETLT